MAYRLETTPAANRQWRKLPTDVQQRLALAVNALGEDPRPHGCVKLSDGDVWRIRVGDFRVVYDIDDSTQTVTITKIKKRDSVYG